MVFITEQKLIILLGVPSNATEATRANKQTRQNMTLMFGMLKTNIEVISLNSGSGIQAMTEKDIMYYFVKMEQQQ